MAAEVPLKVSATADTNQARDNVEGLAEAVEEYTAATKEAAGTNKEAAASYGNVSERADVASKATRATAKAMKEAADEAARASEQTTTAAASFKTATQGLREFQQMTGTATFAVSVFRSKIDEMREASEKATEAFREQAREMGRVAAAGIAGGMVGRRGVVNLQAGRIQGDLSGDLKSVTGESEFARIAGITADYDAQQWEATHRGRGRGGGGRGGASDSERADRAVRSQGLAGQFALLDAAEEQAKRERAASDLRIQNIDDATEARAEAQERYREVEEKAIADQDALRARQSEEQRAWDEKQEDDAIAHQERMRQATSQGFQIASGLADQGMALIGASEAERLYLQGAIHIGEGTAELIGSFGTNPQGYAHIAQGGMEIATGAMADSRSGGGGGGAGASAAGGYSGRGGQGLGGGYSGGGGGDGMVVNEVHNYYGLIDTRDAGDKIAAHLNSRRRRGYGDQSVRY